MCWESSGVVGFDLGPLLQGQMRIAKLKSAYNSLIIGPRGFGALFVYGRPSGSAGSAGSAFCFPYNSVTVRQILFKFGRFRQ